MKLFDYEVKNFGVPVYVAELSCNHGGELNTLLASIEAVYRSGADVVKIQCYEPDSLTWDSGYIIKEGAWKGRNLYNLYKQTQTPFEWIKPAFEFAKSKNIPLMSSVYDLKGLEVLESIGFDAYKIASFEAHNPVFVKKVCLTGKPVIISTGMMDNEEITKSTAAIGFDLLKNICLLHCVSKYPTPVQDTALGRINNLMYNFNVPIGYSDHSFSMYSAAVAVGLGAALIEKHVSVFNENVVSEDAPFSPSAIEFNKMVSVCNQIHSSIITSTPTNEEREIRSSLHIVKEIKAGETIQDEHLMCLRPNLGIHPNQVYRVLGKKVKIDIVPGTPLIEEYIENGI